MEHVWTMISTTVGGPLLYLFVFLLGLVIGFGAGRYHAQFGGNL